MTRNRLAAPVALLGILSGCSVRLLSTDAAPVTTNQCKVDGDCGGSAQCSSGACYATAGSLDEVLFEIVPEATSFTSGGLSFLSAESALGKGNRHLDVTLKPASFFAQIQVDDSSFPAGCIGIPSQPTPIEGVVQYIPSASGDFPAGSIAPTPITVGVAAHRDGTSGQAKLPLGTYDIYVQPNSPAPCALPPRMLRGIEVTANVNSAAPPATLTLPAPSALQGKVTRESGDPNESLAGWQVDLIEPQEGRVISTSAGWPEIGQIPVTSSNFSISYLPVTIAQGNTSSTGNAPNSSPILRMRPPASMAARAPTVYWALSAIDFDGDGSVNLNLSGVPTSSKLVTISGRVVGGSAGVPATLQFVSTSLAGAMGLTASFSQSVTTDASGAYTTALFPGDYKVVAAPSSAPAGSLAASPWAITTQDITVQTAPSQNVGVPLSAKRLVQGIALAGDGSTPALGSVVRAVPSVLTDWAGVWRSALAQTPIVPGGATVGVSSADGSFALSLDPGTFDLSVEPADGSNFAAWVWPHAQIAAPSSGGVMAIAPRLPYPIRVEGNLDDGTSPLSNALLRAYAKVPGGTAVTKVGDTRTDSAGHYILLLPPGFGP